MIEGGGVGGGGEIGRAGIGFGDGVVERGRTRGSETGSASGSGRTALALAVGGWLIGARGWLGCLCVCVCAVLEVVGRVRGWFVRELVWSRANPQSV